MRCTEYLPVARWNACRFTPASGQPQAGIDDRGRHNYMLRIQSCILASLLTSCTTPPQGWTPEKRSQSRVLSPFDFVSGPFRESRLQQIYFLCQPVKVPVQTEQRIPARHDCGGNGGVKESHLPPGFAEFRDQQGHLRGVLFIEQIHQQVEPLMKETGAGGNGPGRCPRRGMGFIAYWSSQS